MGTSEKSQYLINSVAYVLEHTSQSESGHRLQTTTETYENDGGLFWSLSSRSPLAAPVCAFMHAEDILCSRATTVFPEQTKQLRYEPECFAAGRPRKVLVPAHAVHLVEKVVSRPASIPVGRRCPEGAACFSDT